MDSPSSNETGSDIGKAKSIGTLSIKCASKFHEFHFDESTTIFHLKKRLQEVFNIPVQGQKVLLKGKECQDDTLVATFAKLGHKKLTRLVVLKRRGFTLLSREKNEVIKKHSAEPTDAPQIEIQEAQSDVRGSSKRASIISIEILVGCRESRPNTQQIDIESVDKTVERESDFNSPFTLNIRQGNIEYKMNCFRGLSTTFEEIQSELASRMGVEVRLQKLLCRGKVQALSATLLDAGYKINSKHGKCTLLFQKEFYTKSNLFNRMKFDHCYLVKPLFEKIESIKKQFLSNLIDSAQAQLFVISVSDTIEVVMGHMHEVRKLKCASSTADFVNLRQDIEKVVLISSSSILNYFLYC